MLLYIIRRLFQTVPVILSIFILTFFLIKLVPGDPVQMMVGVKADAQTIANIKKQLGVDRVWWQQIGQNLAGIVQGDLGRSYYFRENISDILAQRWPVTIKLAVLALFFALLVGVPAGIAGAYLRHRWLDELLTVFNVISYTLPSFWLAMIMQYFLGVKLKIFPISGYHGGWWELVLPALALGIGSSAMIARLLRGALLEILAQDYVRTARAKGLPRWRILWRHMIPGAILPVLTFSGLELAAFLGGAVLVEEIFNLPGLGQAFFEGINNRDYPLIQAFTLILAMTYVVINLLIDIWQAWLDPRLQLEDRI